MKTIWNILSVLAVANLLAILGFAGWLKATERINLERVRFVKESLVETIPAQKAREADEAAKKDSEAKLQAVKLKESRPPMTAQEKLAVRLEATELDTQRYKKLQSDIEAMQTNLRAQADRLSAERTAFEAEKTAFAALRKEIEVKTADEQFKKTLAALEGMDVKNAVQTLQELLSGQGFAAAGVASSANPTDPGASGEDRVMRYLNALSPTKRNEILNALGKSQPQLAAKLLERLRTYGVLAPSSGNPQP